MVKKLLLLALTFVLVVMLDSRASAATVSPDQTLCDHRRIGASVVLTKCFEKDELRYVGFQVNQSKSKIVIFWQDVYDNRAKFTCTYLFSKGKLVKTTCNPYW
jgi:hypothetical protein